MTAASDPLFDALCKGLEIDPQSVTEPYRRRLERALAQLHEPDLDVLRSCANTFRELGFTRAILTPERVVEHWPDLIRQRQVHHHGAAPVKTGIRFVRGTHSGSYIHDPEGTDKLPPGYEAPRCEDKPQSP
jgi:hypothetical protein